MTRDAASTDATDLGATVVITHRVREGKRDDYDNWLNEIGPLGRAAPGSLDWHIIRPIPGLTSTYTVVVRFDTRAHLREWIESPVRRRLIEKVEPLLVSGDDFFISSGLDFWFTPEGAAAKVPTRWRQSLVTWSAIYPLVLVVPIIVTRLLQLAGAPDNHYLTMLVATGLIVVLMVYLVMPHYTKLIRRWLFA